MRFGRRPSTGETTDARSRLRLPFADSRALHAAFAGGACAFIRDGVRARLTTRAMDIIQPDTCAAGTGTTLTAAFPLLGVLPAHAPPLVTVSPMPEFDRTG